MTIELCERMGDWWIDEQGKEHPKYHAQVKDEPGNWACGRSIPSAIGELILNNPNKFDFNVIFLGKQPR